MYRPNFCAECGAQIVRLKWHFWTSRRFCGACSKRFRKERLKIPLVAAAMLLCAGFFAGSIRRSAAPPLIIERSANSPLYESPNATSNSPTQKTVTGSSSGNASSQAIEEVVYICGARTKKGTPCTRRVHGPVRCWQHKGMRAMLPQDKLIVKD